MRSPQLARCSRDQLRRRMGQHGAVLARGRGGGCEVFRAPPSLGRQLEARLSPRQRVGAGRRAASESTVVDALLATVPPVSLTRQLRPDGLWLCGLKSPGSRLDACAHPLLSTATSPSSTRSPHRLARRRLARRRHARRHHAPLACASSLRSAACAALPAQRRLRRAAFAATPAPRRLRRDACAATPQTRRAAARGAASPGSASHRVARPMRPCLRPAPARRLVRTHITKCSLYTLESCSLCKGTGSLPAAYR